jgi:hypothetical protein
MTNDRYQGWKQQEYRDVSFLQSPDNVRIAYSLKDKVVELTWLRNIGGFSPKEGEDYRDYVRRKLNGAVSKREVKNLAEVLKSLAGQYGRR